MSTVRAEADRTGVRPIRTRRLLAVTYVICLLSTVASAQPVTPADPAPSAPSGSSDEQPPAMPSALSLITALPMDVRHMASLETAIILGTATGVTLALRAHDSSIVSQMEGRMESFLSGGRIAGDLSVQVAASLAVFTAGRIAESPRTAAVGADLVRAQLLNAAFTHATKALVDRRRPDGGPYSFPSGHASATFAAAAVLERHFGWKVGVPAYALGVYTSVSRLTAYQHYPGDVIMGAAIGAVIGRSVSVGRARRAVQVVPVVLHDGVAIQFNMWGSPVPSADVR